MATSDFLPQVDSTRYTAATPVDATPNRKVVQAHDAESNNRSAYHKKLKGAVQKKQLREKPTSRIKTIPPQKKSIQQHSPSTTDQQGSPNEKSESQPVETHQQANPLGTSSQGENDSTEVKVATQVVGTTKPIQVENDSEELLPPTHINELFQHKEIIEEFGAEIFDDPVETTLLNTPPNGLATVLSLETEETNTKTDAHLNINNNRNQIMTVGIDETYDINITGQEVDKESSLQETTNVTSQHREQVPSTIPLRHNRHKLSEVAITNQESETPQETSVENLIIKKPEIPADVKSATADEQSSNENRDVLPLTGNEEQSINLSGPEDQSTPEQIQPDETSQTIPPTIKADRPIESPVAEKNEEKPSLQSPDSESTLKINSKKATLPEPPTSQPQTTPAVQSSVSFTETLSELETASNTKNGITSQEESILNQTTEAVQSSIEQGQSLSIRLTPPELGTIQIQLNIEDGVISARLEVQTPEAHSSIMQHLQSLQESLQQSGTPVDHLTILIAQPTVEDQSSGDTNQSKEQQSHKEQNEKNQKQEHEKQEDKKEEPNDSDQLNIAA